MRAQPPNRSGSIVLGVVLVLCFLLVLGVGGGLFYLDRSYAGKIYPNVTVQGLAVGELTPEQAEAALKARYGNFLDQPVSITYNDQTWEPSLGELGMKFDFSGAIDQAYRAGRGHGMIDNVREVAAIWQNGLDLPLRITYDERATQEYVMALAASIDQAPADAELHLSGAFVSTKPAQQGRQVLVNSLVEQLSSGLQSFKQQELTLEVRDLMPRLSTAAVTEAALEIKNLLQGPVTLTVNEQSYAWQPTDIAPMLNIARVPAGDHTDQILVELNPYQIERRVNAIAEETQIDGTLPRVGWNNGNLKILRPGDNGWRVDEPRARELAITAIQTDQRVIELPMRMIDPPVHEGNLDQLGINELVSVGKSDFSGSAGYRIHNIGVGMKSLNGILLAPGAEFSFNTYIGNIDAANGYVEGAAIVQNRTQLEFGGGICQDSTTIYRAAFWAGLPITERWGHSFYISWYDKYALGPLGSGQGMDATIFTGGPDLKFVNDTGAWLLIQSWSDPKSGVAQVEFYGTKLNRRVELTQRVYDRLPAPGAPVFVTDWKQPQGSIRHSDTARGGMTIDVVRTVYEDGVAREPELFRTRFKPWPNIYVVNPADMGPDGKPLSWGQPKPEEQAPPPAEPPAITTGDGQTPPAPPAPEQPATTDGATPPQNG